MERGNQGRDICDNARDRKLWLETPGEACELGARPGKGSTVDWSRQIRLSEAV
jgi:hypothetical protein